MDTTKPKFYPALKWHWATRFYDQFIAITVPEYEIKAKVLSLVNIQLGEKVLDFGCGTGTGLQIALENQAQAHYYGYDVDPTILDMAAKKLPKEIHLKLGDSSILPFPDQYFDKVWSTWVFHHLRDSEKKLALEEIMRVLKPQGVFVLGDWGKPQNVLMSWLFFILQLVDNFHTTNSNKRGLIPNLMRKAGFSTIVEKGYRNTLFGTFRYWLVRK